MIWAIVKSVLVPPVLSMSANQSLGYEMRTKTEQTVLRVTNMSTNRLADAKRVNAEFMNKNEGDVSWEYRNKVRHLHLRPLRFSHKGSIYIGLYCPNEQHIVAMYLVEKDFPRSPAGYISFQEIDAVIPFTDEQVAEEICFKSEIAQTIEYIRSWVKNNHQDGVHV